MKKYLVPFIFILTLNACGFTMVNTEFEKNSNNIVLTSKYSSRYYGFSIGPMETGNSWANADETARYSAATGTQTAENEGLVFSNDRSRNTLLIYEKNNPNKVFRSISFDRNRKQYLALPNGEYLTVWIGRGGRRDKGVDISVKPGKIVYHDGQPLPWFSGWQ